VLWGTLWGDEVWARSKTLDAGFLPEKYPKVSEVSMKTTANPVVRRVKKLPAPLLPKIVALEPPNTAPISAPRPVCSRTMMIRPKLDNMNNRYSDHKFYRETSYSILLRSSNALPAATTRALAGHLAAVRCLFRGCAGKLFSLRIRRRTAAGRKMRDFAFDT
jgi:hypothetical protein